MLAERAVSAVHARDEATLSGSNKKNSAQNGQGRPAGRLKIGLTFYDSWGSPKLDGGPKLNLPFILLINLIFGARPRATAGRADTVDLFFWDTLLQVTIYGPVWEGRSTATELRAMGRVFGGCFGVHVCGPNPGRNVHVEVQLYVKLHSRAPEVGKVYPCVDLEKNAKPRARRVQLTAFD